MRSARPTPLIFTKLDSDGDGQLSKAELLRILNRFEEFDRNQNGELDPGELLGFPRGAAQQNNSPQNPSFRVFTTRTDEWQSLLLAIR